MSSLEKRVFVGVGHGGRDPGALGNGLRESDVNLVQAVMLMEELKTRLGTSMIMISHDLGVVAKTCDSVAVMYAGEIIEYGTARDIFEGERHHPYTVGLFRAIPDMNEETRRLQPILGLMPDPSDLPPGCKFHPRCPQSTDECREGKPYLYEENGHRILCNLFRKGAAQ